MGAVSTDMLASTALARLAPRATFVPIGQRKDVADEVAHFVIRGEWGRPLAVIHVASPAAPTLAARGAERARAAGEAIGPELGSHVLSATLVGTIEGRSFALYPHVRATRRSRLGWVIQRSRLRPVVLRWLRGVTAATAREIPSADIGHEWRRRCGS